MTTAEDILIGSNAEELTAWSANGSWGFFRTMLRDVEMVEAARQFLPEGHPGKVGLQGIICRALDIMQFRWHGGRCGRGHTATVMLCADQMRLTNRFGSFSDLPQARERTKTMLEQVVRNDMESPLVAPGCKDPQAHRCLLRAWSELDKVGPENKAVEDALTIAFLSHNRTSR